MAPQAGVYSVHSAQETRQSVATRIRAEIYLIRKLEGLTIARYVRQPDTSAFSLHRCAVAEVPGTDSVR